jgi:hypothetical protein
MPEVDRIIADRLPGQVIRDREDLEIVAIEDLEARLQVRVVLVRALEVEMVAGRRDF